jgi:predicted amidohydrolase YtcJ
MAARFATREQRGPISELIDPDGVKIYLDGVPNGFSAPYIDPYSNKATFGRQSIDAPHLNTAVLEFDSEGLQVMMHAVGDMSVRHALDAVEATRKVNGYNIRHHLAHATSVHPEDYGRAGSLNVGVEISPWNTWAPDEGSLTFVPYLGRKRMADITPFKTLLASDDVTGYGSDWDNVPEPDPWFAMECAVTRANPLHPEFGQFGPRQAIDVATAIEVFTINGAFNLQKDDITGTIEVGKSADFIVIDQNLLQIPATDIHKTKVLKTVLMGKTVYDAEG